VDEMNAVYEQCSKVVIDDAVWIPLCMPPNSIITRSNISGVEANSFYPQILWPPALKRA
jgi:peptide/nickel transport system substrate-binding protein